MLTGKSINGSFLVGVLSKGTLPSLKGSELWAPVLEVGFRIRGPY